MKPAVLALTIMGSLLPTVCYATEGTKMPEPKCPTGEILATAQAMGRIFPQRIPYPKGNEDDEGVYGRLTNGQRIAGHLTPSIVAGIGAQSGALLRDGRLPPALRELIIVRTGYHIGSLYEVEQHRSLAARYGITAEKLDTLACVGPVGLAEDEAAVIRFVDELLTTERPSDGALVDLRAHFDDGQILEIVFVTGNWWTLGKMLETAGIPIDEHRIGENGLAAGSDAEGDRRPVEARP